MEITSDSCRLDLLTRELIIYSFQNFTSNLSDTQRCSDAAQALGCRQITKLIVGSDTQSPFEVGFGGPSPVFRNRFEKSVVSRPRSESPCVLANHFIRTPASTMCRQRMHLPAVEGFGIGNGFCFLVDPALSEACTADSKLISPLLVAQLRSVSAITGRRPRTRMQAARSARSASSVELSPWPAGMLCVEVSSSMASAVVRVWPAPCNLDGRLHGCGTMS